MKDLLKKWIDGEVDWSEEKILRQKAKKDPFLSDAMDGYDAFPESEHAATIERLKKHIPTAGKKKTGVIQLYRVAAAAAVVGVIATFFWLQSELQQPTVLSDLAKTEGIAAEKTAPVSSPEPMATLEPKRSQNAQSIEKEAEVNEVSTIDKKEVVKKTTIPSSKPIAEKRRPASPKSKQPNPTVIVKKKEDTQVADVEKPAEMAMPTAPTNSSVIVLEESVVDEFNKEEAIVLADEVEADIPATARREAESKLSKIADRGVASMESKKKSRSTISFIQGEPEYKTYIGTVKNQDGQPLEEVTIQGLGTDNKVITQTEGSFKLIVDSPIEYIIISRPGFHSRKISINQYSDFINVVLTQKSRSTDDFYVNEALPSTSKMTPRPKGGFLKFERYVDKNLVYPQEANEKGIEQDIEVRFHVNEDGIPTKFETQGNDEYGFEKEAIRLIKEGPKWKPVNREVIVIIRFELGE